MKSMFSSLIARLNSLSALNDAMSRFSSGANCFFLLCVCLSCFAPQVDLFHRVHAQHGCFQTVSQVSTIYLKNQVLRANLFHRSRGNGTFHLQQQTHFLYPQVSPIDHRLVWVLVGLVWRILHVELLHTTVERVYRLAVVQLQDPIHHSLWSNRDRVSMRSLVVVEEISMIFHTKLLQSSVSQLLEYNKLEVVLEG